MTEPISDVGLSEARKYADGEMVRVIARLDAVTAESDRLAELRTLLRKLPTLGIYASMGGVQRDGIQTPHMAMDYDIVDITAEEVALWDWAISDD